MGYVFSRPELVLDALKLARTEPDYYDLPDRLAGAVDEVWDAGLVEVGRMNRGPSRGKTVVRLTPAGRARLNRASEAARAAAAGLSVTGLNASKRRVS